MIKKKEILSKICSFIDRFVKKNKRLPNHQEIFLGTKTNKYSLGQLGINLSTEISKSNKKHKEFILKEKEKQDTLKENKHRVIINNILKTEIKKNGRAPVRTALLKMCNLTNHEFTKVIPSFNAYLNQFKKKEVNFCKKYLKDDKQVLLLKRRDAIVKTSLTIIRTTNLYPSLNALAERGFTREALRSVFLTINDLNIYLKKHYPIETQVALAKQEIKAAQMDEKRKEISKKYYDLSKSLKRYPLIREFNEVGVNQPAVNMYFGGIRKLKSFVQQEYGEDLSDVHDVDDLINDIRLARVRKNIKNGHRFFISSIGTGGIEKRFLKSIYNYCKKNKARLLLIPTEIKIDKIDPFILQEYKDGKLDIIFEDVRLCENLHINSVKINEKVVNPAAGISRYQKDNSSFIYASPKQTVKTVAMKKRGFPRFTFSTGAITKPNYMNDPLYKRKRRAMADNDHLVGGLIVEVEGKFFYERQVQMHTDGSFPDFGVRYHQDGSYSIDSPIAFVMGDLHSAEKHKHCFSSWLRVIDSLKIPNVIMHDVFDAKSINPHEKNRITKTLSLALEKKDSLGDELALLVEDLKRVSSVTKNTYIVDSNHDDMLQRAFDSGLIFQNPENAFLGTLLYAHSVIHNLKDDYTPKQIIKAISEVTRISPAVIKQNFPKISDLKSILEYACGLYELNAKSEGVQFLNLESSLVLGGFQLADHGHKGTNGAKGSPVSAARSFVKRISGHTHVEDQFNYVASVGHTTDNPQYARGGSSGWSRSSCLIYKKGQFQSIRYVNGRIRSNIDAFVPKAVNYKDDIKSIPKEEVSNG